MTKSIIFRQAKNLHELKALLKLRYQGYLQSVCASLIQPNRYQIDLDVYDLRALHFGIFRFLPIVIYFLLFSMCFFFFIFFPKKSFFGRISSIRLLHTNEEPRRDFFLSLYPVGLKKKKMAGLSVLLHKVFI